MIRTSAKVVLAGAVAAVLSLVLSATVFHKPVSDGSAGAADGSPFQITGNAAIRKATGTPTPPTGTQATLWANRATASITLEGSGRVVLGATADYCDAWPIVQVTVDGKVVGRTTITSKADYGAYPVGTPVAAGTHKVVIQMINDLYRPPCDRNVHVASARLEQPIESAPAPTPPASSIPTLGPLPPAPSPTATTTPTTQPPTNPAPAPVPPGARPGPGNTGVPDGTKLTLHNGDLTVNKDGTVIDSLDIHGFLNIQASNVTVRRSIIRGGVATGPGFKALVAAYGTHRNFLIEDSTLVASNPSGWMDGLKGRNFTARRLEISRVVDTTLIFGDNVTVEDSWYHDNAYYTPWPSVWDNRTHSDSLQIQGGNNIKVRNNVFEGAANSAVMLTQDYTRTSNVEISGNWLSGGLVCTVNFTKQDPPMTNMVIKDNRFGPVVGQNRCAVIAAPTQPVILSGNTFVDTGGPVMLSKGA
jgi:Ca-dependent carbohydrate-binding module xylan-binding